MMDVWPALRLDAVSVVEADWTYADLAVHASAYNYIRAAQLGGTLRILAAGTVEAPPVFGRSIERLVIQQSWYDMDEERDKRIAKLMAGVTELPRLHCLVISSDNDISCFPGGGLVLPRAWRKLCIEELHVQGGFMQPRAAYGLKSLKRLHLDTRRPFRRREVCGGYDCDFECRTLEHMMDDVGSDDDDDDHDEVENGDEEADGFPPEWLAGGIPIRLSASRAHAKWLKSMVSKGCVEVPFQTPPT